MRTFLDEAPLAPTMHDVMSSDVRSSHIYLEQLRNCRQCDIDTLLSEWGADNFEAEESGTMRQALEIWNKVTGKEATVPRKVGPNTTAALGARVCTLIKGDQPRGSVAKRHAALQESVCLRTSEAGQHRSYEFALAGDEQQFFESFLRGSPTKAPAPRLTRRTAPHARKFKRLPADLLSDRRGKPILYKRHRSVVIYTSSLDLKLWMHPETAVLCGRRIAPAQPASKTGAVVSFVLNRLRRHGGTRSRHYPAVYPTTALIITYCEYEDPCDPKNRQKTARRADQLELLPASR